MSLAALLDEIREDLRALPAITRVYEGVPDSVNEFPAVIVASLGGRCWITSHSSSLLCEHDIRVEVHIPRKDLKADALKMTSLAEDVSHRLYSGFVYDRYNGTMVTPGNPRTANNATSTLDYQVGPSQWAAQETYAMICDFRVTTEMEPMP